MAVNDVYRLSVDYTLADQVTSPISGKTAFIPSFKLVNGSGVDAGSILSTYALNNNGTLVIPKFAAISAASSGNNTLVTAVTGKKIRVLAFSLMASGAVNAKFQSGTGGTDLTGLKYFAAAGAGISQPFNPVGWFETASATLLNLNLSGAVAVGGELVYIEV